MPSQSEPSERATFEVRIIDWGQSHKVQLLFGGEVIAAAWLDPETKQTLEAVPVRKVG